MKGMTLLFEVISLRGFKALDMKELSSTKKEWLKISSFNLKYHLAKSYVPPPFCITLKGEELAEW